MKQWQAKATQTLTCKEFVDVCIKQAKSSDMMRRSILHPQLLNVDVCIKQAKGIDMRCKAYFTRNC